MLSFVQIKTTPAKTVGTEAVGKVTNVFARIRQCIIHARTIAILAFALVLLPLGVLAAPYADFVIDARTGEVLHQTNADTRLHPASLTKMMTLYICFEAIEHGEISLDTMVTVSKFAASQPPSRLGLRAGQKIALRYLIRAAAVKSANDAAAAIGDAIEGNKAAFAQRMNRTAKALGMTRTTFKNPNGLTSEGHLSTARDMTTLGRRLFFDFPQYYSIFSRRSADAGVAQVASTNRRFLDAYEGADGIKTGYTSPAGFNLVASAQRGNKRIIATVFGGTSTAMRNARVAELLDLGFSKAPNRATTQKPPAIAYGGSMNDGKSADTIEVAQADTPADTTTVEPGEDFVALAVANDVDTYVPAAGKTLRVQMAVAQSPLPKLRGSQADGQDIARAAPVAVALAAPAVAVQPQAADEAIAAQATEMANGTDDLMAAMQDSINQAVAEAQQTPADTGFAQTTAPQPETVALASADPAAPAEAVVASMSAIAPASAPVPHTRPATLVAAAPSAAAPAITELAAAPAPADTQPATDMLTMVSALPADQELLSGNDDTQTPVTPETAKLADAVDLTPATAKAEPKPQEIILTAATTVEPGPAQQEVVTRVSTSGGREYGINVGTFSSRYNAERQLLHTALAEMSTLNNSLRKVSNRKNGFDANFIGMTEDAADMACRRLVARGTDCKVIGPGA